MMNWIEKKIAYIKYALTMKQHGYTADKALFERFYTK